jgi:glycerophosphoryl diester phosphodiesterase
MSAFRREGRVLIYGHRGVRGPAGLVPPENTMAAFERARQEGADGVELDVRQTQDGEVVVFHDPTLRRMTQGFDSRAISAVTRAQLSLVDLGGGERAPTLEAVLQWIAPTSLLLNVEMKRDLPSRTGLVRAVAKVLRGRLRGRLIISSFDPLMLAAMNVLLPGVPLALLFHAGDMPYRPWPWARFGPWQAAHPEHLMIDREQLRSLRGRIVNVWTVNDDAEARRLADAGVDGVITDRPGAIRAALR